MTATRALYTEDAYRRDCAAEVVAAGPDGVVLDQTVFYPLGGGQPGDTGWLRTEDGRAWRVRDTRKAEGGVVMHLLEGNDPPPAPGTRIHAEIDWDRRYAHMRMHTCLHLLGAVLRYGVTGGQVGAEKSRLDFDTQDEIDKARVTDAVNALVMANQPVTSRWITDAELDAQPELVRTLSVQPPRGVGKVRLLEIRGVDLQPCGGTHVAATGEIGPIEVRKVESKGKRNKRVVIALAG
ncbi:alanyl-tRNA editing protein [Thioalkalivibrio sp. XN279]|uniref:alanyl-tRNA editing protein n=1 Tax=Thioalkalivibrio sp. XN279 TaxID=2714953 RepID=UPI00140E2BC9|nr:alanyl-tRNA editing protein [Thioalkalivibrio sp. XN279]NHA15096.1 alanyl-tRNA editing protein [Thioalkalivibrio sp. XN279]